MKNWIFILFLLPLTSCDDSNKDASQNEPSLKEMIHGGWISIEVDSTDFRREYSFNFEDSLLFLFSYYCGALDFSISDSIVSVTPQNSNTPTQHQDLRIIDINSDSLKLILLPSEWKGFRQEIPHMENDTLVFSRITMKNKLKPLKIGFSSTVCFGSCPAMKLEIDQDRNIKFYGQSFTDLKGGYSGKVPQHVYDRILNQIRALPLDTLEANYSAPYTCAPTCSIMLKMKDTTIHVRSYGNYLQPYELPIL